MHWWQVVGVLVVLVAIFIGGFLKGDVEKEKPPPPRR
jgi:hypothetical protein